MVLLVLLAQVFSTIYMTGLIWFVQVVHYPLHGEVGVEQFQRYQELHMKWTSLVVMPPMIIELVTTLYFLFIPHPEISHRVWIFGAAMLGVVWISTGLLQVPAHSSLIEEFSILNHQKLVNYNWIRTLFWSARSALLIWVLWTLIK